MLRTALRLSVRPSLSISSSPFVLTTTRGMAEGATGSGSSRAGGIAAGDAYTKREKANEDYYVKQKEKEK